MSKAIDTAKQILEEAKEKFLDVCTEIDQKEDLRWRGTIYSRSLIQLVRDRRAVLLEDEDRIGRGKGDFHCYHRQRIVSYAVFSHDSIKGDRQERHGDHIGHQRSIGQHPTPLDAQAADREAGKRPDDQRQRGDDDADPEAGAHLRPEFGEQPV